MINEQYCMDLRRRLSVIETKLMGTLLQRRFVEGAGTPSVGEAEEASVQLRACLRVRQLVAESEAVRQRIAPGRRSM